MHAALEFKQLRDKPPSALSQKQVQLLTQLATEPEKVRNRAEDALQ